MKEIYTFYESSDALFEGCAQLNNFLLLCALYKYPYYGYEKYDVDTKKVFKKIAFSKNIEEVVNNCLEFPNASENGFFEFVFDEPIIDSDGRASYCYSNHVSIKSASYPGQKGVYINWSLYLNHNKDYKKELNVILETVICFYDDKETFDAQVEKVKNRVITNRTYVGCFHNNKYYILTLFAHAYDFGGAHFYSDKAIEIVNEKLL